MELINSTDMAAGQTTGLEPNGREAIVVAVKGTFRLDGGTAPPKLSKTQPPLLEADTFEGEPGFSAPVYEAEFAPKKPKCDVLVSGTAYAPNGDPTRRVDVGFKVGDHSKRFFVVGDRKWDTGNSTPRASDPKPFTEKPISYACAFGGVDNTDADETKHSAFLFNPVGRGWYADTESSSIDGQPLPNTEEIDRPITAPGGDYRPMALGPVGRGWKPRSDLAGTYDEEWLENHFPFLPPDFKEAHYQSAPADQQIPYPAGGEEVTLLNLTRAGLTRFRLPEIAMPIVFLRKDGGREEAAGVIDTICIEPEKVEFSVIWRASLPLRRNAFEISQIVVGEMPRAWWRARETGKDYYPSVGAAAGRPTDA